MKIETITLAFGLCALNAVPAFAECSDHVDIDAISGQQVVTSPAAPVATHPDGPTGSSIEDRGEKRDGENKRS